MLKRALAALAVPTLLLTLAACGEDDNSSRADDDTTSDTSSDAAPESSTTEDSTEAGVACEYPTDGSGDAEPPPSTAPESGTAEVTLSTSIGDLALTLDRSATPCTVNSFVSLSEQGYFDGTTCHRLTKGAGLSVLQCGDPTATGSGGPGYSFADELGNLDTSAPVVDYPAGTLAMANAGPNTNGSQFFIVYADSQLPPKYTVFGSVDEASVQLVADSAADAGDSYDGPPTTPVDIETATVG